MWYNLTLEYVPQRVPRGAERVFTMGLFTKLFGTRSEREVKKLEPQVEAVMALEEPYKKLTDQELRAKTQEFKDRYASGETLDALLPEAFWRRAGRPGQDLADPDRKRLWQTVAV